MDMVKAAILLALGEKPLIRSTCRKGAAIRFLCAEPGTINSIDGIDSSKRVSGICEVDVYKKVGDTVMPLIDASGRVGHVISVAKNVKSAIICAEQAQENIFIDTII